MPHQPNEESTLPSFSLLLPGSNDNTNKTKSAATGKKREHNYALAEIPSPQ
jgi:hypothetical protein